jgi:hypothetical protein
VVHERVEARGTRRKSPSLPTQLATLTRQKSYGAFISGQYYLVHPCRQLKPRATLRQNGGTRVVINHSPPNPANMRPAGPSFSYSPLHAMAVSAALLHTFVYNARLSLSGKPPHHPLSSIRPPPQRSIEWTTLPIHRHGKKRPTRLVGNDKRYSSIRQTPWG